MLSKQEPLVSIIMPAFNVAEYIEEAIQSVLDQTYKNWELLIINDGSTDKTAEKIRLFTVNEKIRYFTQENNGVSVARNLGLANMKGEFFCFLDADDKFPIDSIKLRIRLALTDKTISFIDGKVITYDMKWQSVLRTCIPTYIGNPLSEIVKLRSSCLCAISWMVKVQPEKKYYFQEGWSHSEDMAFYIDIVKEGGLYISINEPVYLIRKREGSAMSDLKGLANGYRNLYVYISQQVVQVKWFDRFVLKFKIIKIMFLSFIADKQYKNAFLILLKFLFI